MATLAIRTPNRLPALLDENRRIEPPLLLMPLLPTALPFLSATCGSVTLAVSESSGRQGCGTPSVDSKSSRLERVCLALLWNDLFPDFQQTLGPRASHIRRMPLRSMPHMRYTSINFGLWHLNDQRFRRARVRYYAVKQTHDYRRA